MRPLYIIAIALCTICSSAWSQERQQRITREELAEAQALHIAAQMELDEGTSEQFVDAYCQFQSEIWALGPRPSRQSDPQATEQEVGQGLRLRFAHSQKILNIREKYYHIYSQFLTQSQIERVYHLERQMMDRLARRRVKK